MRSNRIKTDEFGQPFDEKFTLKEKIQNAALDAKMKIMGDRYFKRHA